MGQIGVAPQGNITPRESGPTSIGWFITRTGGQLTQGTRQMSAGRSFPEVPLVRSPAPKRVSPSAVS